MSADAEHVGEPTPQATSPLAEDPEFLALLFEHAPDAKFLVDANGRILRTNASAEQVFGYHRSELLGQSVEMLIPQRFVGAHVGHRAGYMSAPRIRPMGVGAELFARRKDGSEVPVDIMLSSFQTPQGMIALAVVRDVTERKRAEAQAREARETQLRELEVRRARAQLESIVESSPAVLYRLAGPSPAQLRLSWISANVHEMTGCAVDEAMEPTWWNDRLHPEERQQVYAQISAELLTLGRLTQEYRFRHLDGKYRWVQSELRLLRDAPGEPVEVVGSWADITSRKALEEQFRQAQKMEAIGQLAGGVAHDFNNLLTVISGYSQILLSSSELDERKRSLALEISKAGDRAAALTRQLLAFSRKQVWAPRVLDLNAVITDQTKMLSRLIGEDIEFHTRLDPKLYKVKTDQGQFEQVIMNLAINARDAMPAGGSLTLETRNSELDASYASTHAGVEPGPYALIAISDTGSGMSREVLEHLFEPFFTTKHQGEGTGLGLATAYGIIKQSGGHIMPYSEPGHGTTFKIYLPPAAEQVPTHPLRAGDRPMPTGREIILLVEDESAVRAIARHVLDSCGYTVFEAADGPAALRWCQQHEGRIDLLVTDVVMPGMAGRVLVEKVASLRPEAKVLYMSGYTDDAVIRQGIIQEETAFLQKPFTPYALASMVRQVLDA